MAATKREIPNLLGGVSQQPTHRRTLSQAELSVNMYPLAERGLGKRPSSQRKAAIATTGLTAFEEAFIHSIIRDSNEQFRLVLMDGAIKAFDADGNEITVRTPNGVAYLSSAITPRSDFRAATVGDRTVITNRQVTTAKAITRSPLKVFEALLFVRDADFDVNYQVTINGTDLPPVRTLANDDPGSMDSINTTQIASLLTDNINDNAAGYTATQFGSAVHVVRDSGADFTIVAQDGLGGEGLSAIKGKVQQFEDLPKQAPDGFTVEVTGDPTTGFDNFFVTYSDNDAVDEQGVWNETVAQNEQIAFDASTMPHELIRNGVIITDFEVAAPLSDPTVSAVDDAGGEISEGWATSLNGAETETKTMAAEADELFSNVDNANGLSTLYTVTFDANFGAIGDKSATLTLYINDGVSSTSWTQVAAKTYYQSDGSLNDETISFTTAVLDANFDVRVVLTYSDVILPTDAADIFMKTLTYTPITADMQVDFGATTIYPEGVTVTVTVNGNAVPYTVTGGDETGTEVAVGIEPSIEAEPNITSSITSAGVVKLEDSGGTATVLASTDFDATKRFITTGLGVAADDLIGDTVENISDGSTMTVTDNTDKTVVGTAGLSGGTDNTFQTGDVCRVVGTGTYFVFRQATWVNRLVGNTTTNPFPSLTEAVINDVFFWKNRLGFLSGENVVMSRVGEDNLFNLFRETVTDLLDTDPIDINAVTSNVSVLTNAIQYSNKLILQSDVTEFVLEGEPLLSPKTARLPTVSNFGASRLARPVVVGDSMYFMKEQANASRLYRYTINVDEENKITSKDAQWLNAHAPTYMLGTPVCLAASETYRTIAMVTSDDQSKIFVYNYFDDEQGNRLQSALTTWQMTGLDATVIGIDFLDETMGVVVKRGDSVDFEILPMNPGHTDVLLGAADTPIFLDRRITDATAGVSMVYDGGDDETTITVPYNMPILSNAQQIIYEDTFAGTNNVNLVDRNPTGVPAFPSRWDNGEGSGMLPSTLVVNPAKIIVPGVVDTDGEAINAALFGLFSGACVGEVTTVFDDFTLEMVGRMYSNPAGYGGTNGGPGMIFRSDNHRADPEDNSESAEQGQFFVLRFDYDSNNELSISVVRYLGGGAANVGVPGTPQVLESGIAYSPSDTFLLRGTVVGNKLTVVRSTVSGNYTTLLKTVVEDWDLTNGGAWSDLNSAAYGAFGVWLPALSNVDGIHYLRLTSTREVPGQPCVVNRANGEQIAVTGQPASNQIVVAGDVTALPLYIGLCYDSNHQLSTFHEQVFGNDGKPSIVTDGRLQVRQMWLDFDDARQFSVEVASTRGGETRTKTTTFTDNTVVGGRCSNEPNVYTPLVPVFHRNDECTITIKNSSPYQARFHSGHWSGSYNSRNRLRR